MSIQQILLATAAPVPGQQVFTSSDSWTVPSGVFSISVVCVQQGGDASANGTEVVVAASTVCRAKNGARIGDGGGDGGQGGFGALVDPTNSGGGGGAGGYNGNGGAGGNESTAGAAGAASSGAGGGGGGGDYPGLGGGDGLGGGGVGLLGLGSTGAGGAAGNGGGGGGSGGSTGVTGVGAGALYGGAPYTAAGSANGASGGALSYKNNVAVTPGSTVTVTIPTGVGSNGAVRIMWGVNRAYPSTNTGDM